jgi:galactokinase
VPLGSGLSSSAALEVSAALALGTLGGEAPAGTDLADLCRAAEHEFAKVPCGIMDQYVSVLAREGCALLLDCRSRTWEHIPLRLGEYVVVVINSGVRHALAAGEYAARLAQCQQAVEFFRGTEASCRSLRDVSEDLVRANRSRMDPVAAARALHVVTENERTLAAADALRRGDLAEFGRQMQASHVSLRDDYQVSCRELDLLVEIVSAVPGVAGARMTGGGFGGCIVALARRDALPAIQAAVHDRYDAAGLGPSSLLVTQPGAGAAVESGLHD